MIRFYSPDIIATGALPESDSRHAIRVLRMRPGDTLEVVDGRGGLHTCRLVDDNPRSAAVEVVETRLLPLPWPQQLTVAVAPTKHMDRMEWLVEKMTEIGVNRIVPLLTRRSERREIRVDRLEKIAVSAMKQSLKAFLPEILPMTPLEEVLAMSPGATRVVAYCLDDEMKRRDFADVYVPRRDTLLLIGPEGDFTPDEVDATLAAGFLPVTFGDNRLRTETAALYGLAACHVIDSYCKQ